MGKGKGAASTASTMRFKVGAGAGAGTKEGTGGNPNARAICKYFAATGQCRFTPNCRFRHVYGNAGHLAFMAQEALASPGQEITVESLGGLDTMRYNSEVDAYEVNEKDELETAVNSAIICGVCDTEFKEDFKDFLEAGAPDFRRQPRAK